MRRLVPLVVLALTLAAAPVARADDDSDSALKAAASSGDVGPMSHLYQTWNNCGPASVAMALSQMGIAVSQEDARLALRGPDIRRGMPAQNVDPWVRTLFGLRAVVRTGGTAEGVKRFITNGFPVIVTQWLDDASRTAHYRVVRGFSDVTGAFYVNDPMRGANVPLGYEWFVDNWKSFSYRYLVLYRPADEARVKALVGADWDEVAMRERLYDRARTDASRTNTATAWLAYGEAAYQYGKFAEAVGAFEQGLRLGSGSGVFTLRVSYPMALRLVYRAREADAASARFASLANAPVAAPSAADAIALALAASRVERLTAE